MRACRSLIWPISCLLLVGTVEVDDGEHWAFVPPKRPAVPVISDPSWVSNPIDAHVLARLEREGLMAAPEADKVTLLRRLSLDLVGLPPTIEQVQVFLADDSPDAYEKQVERFLASPHYGERWGRHWLDAARYADSDGYEKDKRRRVWYYRDWVIGALNRDLPYDQFIIEQIAGDLIPDATQDQIVATGFLRNSMINEEGGTDPEQFRMEALFDRMDAVGKSILGLTIQCAQCHDHKYDPISQEEYYRMFAFLNSDHDANMAVYSPEQQGQRAEVFRGIRQINRDLQHKNPDWSQAMAQWEQTVKDDQGEWLVVRPTVDATSATGQKFTMLDDGSFLAAGFSPIKNRLELTVKVDLKRITAFRLELLRHLDLPMGGPGRSIMGTAALTEFEVKAASVADPQQMEEVKIHTASADINLPQRELDEVFRDKSDQHRVTGPIVLAIDGDEKTAWGIDAGPGRRNQSRKAVFVAKTPIENPDGTILKLFLSQKHGGWNNNTNQSHNMGRFRLSITAMANAVADPLPLQVRQILSIPRQQRTPEQVATIFGYWRRTVPQWQHANERIDALWRQYPEGSAQLVLAARQRPRRTHVLERGDFLRPLGAVDAGVPTFLNPMPTDAPPNRLSFARWLVDHDGPTTGRAIVNRVWQIYFGIGLVATSEDIGLRGDVPSHPKLLDYLAVEFIENGWSLKQLHRLITNSSTYRQSSVVSPELLEHDPNNRLLARGARFRVEAEVVRDIALAASGLLNGKIGGPSIDSPAPAFLFDRPASFWNKEYNEETGPDRYRRALYTFRYRTIPYPALEVFDAPIGNVSCVRRSRSNTPLAALTSLNETLFVECARALGRRTVQEGGSSDADRLTYAFRLCLARLANEEESAVLLEFLRGQKQRLAAGGLDALALAGLDSEGQAELYDQEAARQLAAWTAVARVLLNLDETISRE